MCGITGILGRGNADILQKMTSKLANRGPDAETFWKDESQGVFFGHRRLSIIDLDGGHQPMRSKDGRYSLVFNGAIYNSPELRTELEREGARFISDHSDTEVLLNAYIHWGREMLQRLNGMWAFAIYDSLEKKLFCSRDRFGQKPFYFYKSNGLFAFSSQLDSLLMHPDIPRNINSLSVKKYLAYSYVPEPATLISDVFKLPAGSFLIYKFPDETLAINRYWDFKIEPHEPKYSIEELGEEIRELLQRAVKRRMLADVPLGLFLSGGLDSSIISGLARKVTAIPPKCFSVSFNETGFDESAFGQHVAEYFNLDLHITALNTKDVLTQGERALMEIDDPIGDSSLVPTFLLCHETSKHVKVALGGDGADELFAGYAPFLALGKAQKYRRFMPESLHHLLSFMIQKMPVSHRYMSLDFKLKKTFQGLNYPAKLWMPVWMSALTQSDMQDLFHEPIQHEEIFEDAIRIWDSCPSSDPIDRALTFFTKLYLNHAILHKVDRASMMNGLEVRSPFLDHEVAEFAMRLPARFKLRGSTTKFLLRSAFKDMIPKKVLSRTKHGFALPVGTWMRSGQISEEPNIIKELKTQRVVARWEKHLLGKKDDRLFLWNHLSLNRSWLIRGNSNGHFSSPDRSTVKE